MGTHPDSDSSKIETRVTQRKLFFKNMSKIILIILKLMKKAAMIRTDNYPQQQLGLEMIRKHF